MTDDYDDNRNEAHKFLVAALQEVGNAHRLVAQELHRMADADPPYTCFTYTSPAIKNVWRAAAELLESRAR